MSPVRACNRCGRGNCTRHRPAPRPTRAYSNTAAYRQMVDDVLDAYGDRCYLCGHSTLEPVRDLVLAHHPVSHIDGGPFELQNLRPAHDLCNKRAGR